MARDSDIAGGARWDCPFDVTQAKRKGGLVGAAQDGKGKVEARHVQPTEKLALAGTAMAIDSAL